MRHAPRLALAASVASLLGSASVHAGSPFEAGARAMEAGDLRTARDAFAQARQQNPGSTMTRLHWAMVSSELEPNNPEVLRALEQCAAEAPNNPRVHYYLGLTYGRNGRYGDAEAALRRALALRPNLPDAHFQLAVALQEQGKLPEAAEFLTAVVRDEPEHLGAWMALAQVQEARERLQEAETALRRIVSLQPQVAYHHYRLAQFLERTGQHREAKKVMRQANELDPQPQRNMRPLRVR